MGMPQLWFLDQFKQPRLALDAAHILARDDADLMLDDDEMELQMTLASAQERDGVLHGLRALCQPAQEAWRDLRSLPPAHPLANVVDALYVAGYVEETAQPPARAQLQSAWRRTVQHYVDLLARHAATLAPDRHARFTAHLQLLLGEVRRLLRTGPGTTAAPDPVLPPPLWSNDNFYVLTMQIQLRYAHRNNALGLALIHQLLCLLEHGLGLAAAAPDEAALAAPLEAYLVNVYHDRDAEACLYAFTEFLQAATTPAAARACLAESAPPASMAGINFALGSEDYARACSAMLGESRFFAALQDPANHLLMAPACYLQEYFVNYRFVETITPMITKRLTPRLKEMFWRYYSEEIGHEQFELETCRQLGIDTAYIASHLPLPLTQAFCDSFSYLSECEEIGYLTSVMVTEGMPGDPSLINQILSHSPVLAQTFNSASLAHEELNQELAHQFLSRIFLSQIPSVDPATQARALSILSYMIELNFRAWEDLHQRVVVEGQPYMADAVWPAHR